MAVLACAPIDLTCLVGGQTGGIAPEAILLQSFSQGGSLPLVYRSAGEAGPVYAQTTLTWRSKASRARQTHWRAAMCLLTQISHSCG